MRRDIVWLTFEHSAAGQDTSTFAVWPQIGWWLRECWPSSRPFGRSLQRSGHFQPRFPPCAGIANTSACLQSKCELTTNTNCLAIHGSLFCAFVFRFWLFFVKNCFLICCIIVCFWCKLPINHQVSFGFHLSKQRPKRKHLFGSSGAQASHLSA